RWRKERTDAVTRTSTVQQKTVRSAAEKANAERSWKSKSREAGTGRSKYENRNKKNGVQHSRFSRLRLLRSIHHKKAVYERV
ncbi:hypothetical protein, partial [Clostridioides difficile]|uniref:hypothetical protein n=1 Tax=Clostridioides difficile TaxID=1496 RepID=UPI000BDB88D5